MTKRSLLGNTPTNLSEMAEEKRKLKRQLSIDDRLRGTHRLMRWPLLLLICIVLLIELLMYAILRTLVFVYEKTTQGWSKNKHRLRNAKTYVEWATAAKQLDKAKKRNLWKQTDSSNYYDSKTIRGMVNAMKSARSRGDVSRLHTILLEEVFHKHRIWVGFDKQSLYSQSYFGTKEIIYDFIEEVIQCVAVLKDYSESHPDNMDRDIDIDAFAQQCLEGYGHTAICLSGGGAMGYYHFGIIKALLEMGLMPRIISGASAGAMVAAWTAVRTDEEMLELLNSGTLHTFLTPFEESWSARIYRFITQGCVFSNDIFSRLLLVATKGNTTFLEAFHISGRILNIPVTSRRKHGSAVVLNYQTAPNVCIWSAVLASSSIPGLLKPVRLMAKDPVSGCVDTHTSFGETWCDGSIKNDVPRTQLTEMFNVTRFLVCQVNPHVVPFLYDNRGSSGDPSPHEFGSRLRGGFISATLESFLKLEMRKWLRLIRELDLIPGIDLRSLWLQNFVGDVTIHPRFRNGLLWSYCQFTSDPSKETLDRFILEGQRMTWPSLCMISNHSIFENLLRRCLKENRKRSLSSLRPLS